MMVFKTTLVLLVLVLVRSGMSVSDTDIRNAFELMAQDAKQERDDRRPNAKQVLSISVFSDTEVEFLNLIPEGRRRIFLNTPKGSLNESEYFSNTNAEIHGEIIALYINDTINELLEVFNETDEENRRLIPNILVYSYYIPCAEVQNIPYSCAEEVAKASKYYGLRSRMFVGYSDIFKGTNKDRAIEFLLNSGIESVLDLRYNVIPDVTSSSLPMTRFFQKLMHTCLIRQNTLCRGNAERDQIIAYQVNVLTKRCTEEASLFYGTISTFGLNFLGSCLESQTWRPCCGSRAREADIKLEVRKCMNSTMNDYKPTAMHAIQFGSVKSLTDTEWTHISEIERKNWSELFVDLLETDPYPDNVMTISPAPCISNLSIPKRNVNQYGPFIQRLNEDVINMEKRRPGNRQNP